MKKGIIIGISAGLGAIALGLGIFFIIQAVTNTPGEDPKQEETVAKDGFVLDESNYVYYFWDCKHDAMDVDMLVESDNEIKTPYKTGELTSDGYPIYAVKWTWDGMEVSDPETQELYMSPSHTYICRFGTTKDSAYLIDLTVDGEKRKEYHRP